MLKRLLDLVRRRRSSPDGAPADPTARTMFVASIQPQNVDTRPLAVTERAQDARTSRSSEPRDELIDLQRLTEPLFEPLRGGVADHAVSPEQRRVPESRQAPVVRVDADAIAHPAPRRALSPAEALRLASGTTRSTDRRLSVSPHPTPTDESVSGPDVEDTTQDTADPHD